MKSALLPLLLLCVPSWGITVYTVCASGCTYTGLQLQTALNDAQTNQDAGACANSGDQFIIDITAGTSITSTNYTIPNKTCNQYITVRTASCNVSPGTRQTNSASLAQITAPVVMGGGLQLGVFTTVNGGHSRYWHFDCLEPIGGTGGTTSDFIGALFQIGGLSGDDATHTTNFDHFIFTRNYMHGQVQQNGPLRGISYNGGYVEVEDNYITEIHEHTGDSQAFLCGKCTGPGLIKNNYLAASGENLMWGGTGQAVKGNVPTGFQVIGNESEKPYAWALWIQTSDPVNGTNHCMNGMSWFNSSTNHRWQCNGSDTWIDQGVDASHICYDVKGGFEIKDLQNVQFVANQFVGGWNPQSTGCADQQAFAMFPMNQVDVGENDEKIWQITSAFNKADVILEYSYFGVIGTYYNGPGYIYHHDNLITDMDDGRAMPLGNPDSLNFGMHNLSCCLDGNIRFENLTAERSTQAGSTVKLLGALLGGPGGIKGTNSGYINNIAPYGFYGFTDLGGGGGSGACAYLGEFANPAGVRTGGNIFSTEDGTGITTGTVSPGCTNASHLWPTGTLSNALITNILDASFKPKVGFTGSGTDGRNAGANIDLLNAMVTGALTGTYNPMWDTWINGITSDSTSITVYATAYDTTACTWELSTDGGAYSSPISVSSQTRNGRAVTAVWSGSALAVNTLYWLRMTCAGQPGQEWMRNGVSRANVMTVSAFSGGSGTGKGSRQSSGSKQTKGGKR